MQMLLVLLAVLLEAVVVAAPLGQTFKNMRR
jgi:hypothetical protein